ncbi:pyridoxal phosphate-dependent transferase [Roridomyces roridus]|uniref:Pyridoxal phosphate-dependent transferase n=1 Tax=Roridomyces roridus TaxID=1738132 RepID=A0AAD7CBC4_9AGAR|nr:pyridoxal phosphate-dependent transferase [Roridomyces roridus]
MPTKTKTSTDVPLGLAVPADTAHAISVSLPKWQDNVGYEEAEKRVVDAMVSGYPRFFIHLSIVKLADSCAQKFGTRNESCMLFPSHRIAELCRSFIQDRSSKLGLPPVTPRLIHFSICPEDKLKQGPCVNEDTTPLSAASANLHIVLFPADAFPVAKEFWQHTGLGISSRLAEHCLSLLPAENAFIPNGLKNTPRKALNKHYSATKASPPSPTETRTAEGLGLDHSVYLEERYGRNLPIASAAAAKRALRRRIAGVVVRDNPGECIDQPCAGNNEVALGPSTRGIEGLSENDVFLFPTGMGAIWSAHQLCLAVRPPQKSVCLGFTYTDTLKVLEKWGEGCHFLADGNLDDLEKILEEGHARDPNTPPILSLFTEFPSNPLLRSADLPRLRALADKYDFLVVIDETVGCFINVEVFPYADIVVSSLTKVFSGYSNVMGGSLCLNPQRRHYEALKARMTANYEDTYFDQDAIYMERNSRDFQRRVPIIDANAEAVCNFLQAKKLASPTSVVKEVFYPKFSSRENYDFCRIKGDPARDLPEGGYGGLFSVTFTSMPAAMAFFDALACYKGPSLGTNFTLACPYTILAHYQELKWAEGFGVEPTLVRVSVGMEETEVLLGCFETALEAAEQAVA